MHVLHILNSTSGGSAESTIELITIMKEEGVRSSLTCADNGTARQRERLAEVVQGRALFLPLYWINKKIRARWWKRPAIEAYHLYRTWGGRKHQKTIQRFIREQEVNLLHTSTILNPEGAYAARALGLPHLWHVRELVGPDKHFRFYNYPGWARFVQSHCDVLVANSDATLQCLRPFFPEEHLVKIPNAIDVGRFSLKTHQNHQSLVVGMIGNITSRLKNHAFFIAVAGALKNNPGIRFELYGRLPNEEDPYFRRLRRQVESLELTRDQFSFAGFAAPEEITRHIDILFHPTELESFGRIFVEAMAAGLPVIGINEGGATEMIRDGENGFLAPKNDIAAVVRCIETLAADPALRQRMGERGRALAEAEYDLPILARRMKALYEQVLAEKKRSAIQ